MWKYRHTEENNKSVEIQSGTKLFVRLARTTDPTHEELLYAG